MFEPMELTNDAVIKVIGVGGGGGNAVEHMVREVAVSPKDWALALIQKLAAMRLMRIAMHCVRRWKVQTWSLLLRVWVVVPVQVQHQSSLKWQKIWVS